MRKAVFLGSAHITDTVYPKSVRRSLSELLRFETDEVIDEKRLDDFRNELRDAEYAFSTWGMPCLSREEIREYMPSLKAVFYAAGTVQKFARPFLEEGVEIYSAWAANAVPVAEFTFAEIILAAKGFYQRLHRQGDSSWDNRGIPVEFPGNYDMKVGIVGAGMIGKMVIERLRTLSRVTILVSDPFLPDEKAEELGVWKTDLRTVFSECDVISNHTADNPDTVGMMNREHFSLMKPGAVFINTGRGAQVVEEDLIAALKEDPTRAAVLDVTKPEPPEEDSPLYRLDNVFLTPHIAGSLGNEVHRMAQYMYEECLRREKGDPARYRVTAEMLRTMA